MRHGGPAPAMGLQESVPELRLQLPAGRLLRLTNAECGVRNAESRTRMSWLEPPPDIPHSRMSHLLTVEIIALVVLVTVYLLQRLARAGFIRHRVRRQWRVAWAHVRRAPRWALGAGAVLTVVSIVARALILPALAWGMPGRPPFAQMFYGALALLHAPLVVPLPSGGGGLEVAFLNGFAGDFGPHQVTMLLLWRFYTAILLTGLGVYALVRSIGYRAAVEVFKIGWGKRRETP